jgi:peroxiredoxin
VQVLIVDVKENEKTCAKYVKRGGFTFPMLRDVDGAVATTYAPAEAQPDLDRDQVPIASNMLIDREGKIVFWTLLDTRNFDAKLVALTAKLNEMLAAK